MKTRINITAGSLLLGGVLLFSLYGIGQSLGSDEDDGYFKRNIEPSQDPLYLEECGSCHMAYPRQLLPAQSWQKIMAGLTDHFGDNAELDPQATRYLTNYLTANKRDWSDSAAQTPLRITMQRYFIHEHDEIPSRFIEANDKVGSLAQCNACHRGAEQGEFDEDDVLIPGFGRWDD